MLGRLLHTGPSRALSIRAGTIYSPTETSLAQYLQQCLPSTSKSSPHPSTGSIFLLSTSLPSSTLEPLLSVLHRHCPSSIGSFGVTPPNTEPHISIATFDDTLKTFYTPLTGRSDPAVGRWHTPRRAEVEDLKGKQQGEIEDVERQEGWAGVWRAEEGVTELVPELEGYGAGTILTLSDGHPTPVLQSLNAMFPSSTRAGLLTAPTPFITGRPHTLFRDGQVYSSGTVGLALKDKLSYAIEYGLKPLTPPYPVTRAQGNLLMSIDDGGEGNPARTLIAALQRQKGRAPITKEEEWFLSIRPADGGSGEENVVRILSGDPSKGALSLETEASLVPGQMVQFLHRPESAASINVEPQAGRMVFAGARKAHKESAEKSKHDPRVVEGFTSLSEEGFTHGTAICKVPGARLAIPAS